MTGPMDESNEAVEQAMGMSLEQARDTTAITYANVWLRLMCRELGMDNFTSESLQPMAHELTVGLNSGIGIAFFAIVGDRRMAEHALDELRAIVERIPA